MSVRPSTQTQPRYRATIAVPVGLAVLLGLMGGLCRPLLADTVHLTNGRSLDGRAVIEDNGDVALYSSMGMIRLPKTKVSRVETSDTVEDRILDQLDSLRSPTADDLYELAYEANRGGASTLARELYQEALRLNPNHAASLRALNSDSRIATVEPPANGSTGAPPAVSSELEAEQLKLLRALRAQANAARRAELQRQLLLAAQLSEAAAQASRRQGQLYQSAPIATYGQVFLPRAPEQTRVSKTPRPDLRSLGPQQPRPRATPAVQSRRKSTIVTVPRP